MTTLEALDYICAYYSVSPDLIANTHPDQWRTIYSNLRTDRIDLRRAIRTWMIHLGYVIELADVATSTSTCQHSYINVGFSSIRMVCRHCDLEQAEEV